MIKENNNSKQGYSVIDSFFFDRKHPDKDVFKGYQLVKYNSGEFGIIFRSVGVNNEAKDRGAYSLNSVHERGIEQDVRRTFESLKTKHLGLKPPDQEKTKSFQLKENQQIVAHVSSISRDANTGLTNIKLKTEDRTLVMKIKNEHARNIQQGSRIAINGTNGGIKINVLRTRERALKRAI